MATKTANKTQTPVEMPDVISFRQMLDMLTAKGKDNAVFARHIAQDLEATAKRLKEDADETLYNLKDNAKVIATDAAGNTWAVMFVPQNQKKYDETDEYVSAIEAVEEATEHLKAVQERTPFKMVRKGERGYSYKVTKV